MKIVIPRDPRPKPSLEPISSELEVRIRKRYHNPEGTFNLNVHFRALAGFTILFGPSGAGKTTLLDCIAGLTPADEGRIAVGGEDLYDSEKNKDVAAWKRRIGYVHQDLALFPHLTAEENVAYGLRAPRRGERRSRSREMLAMFSIAHLRDRLPAQISGGERQRVALARALVTEPRACYSMNRWPRWIVRQSPIWSPICANGTSSTASRFSSSLTAAKKSLLWATRSLCWRAGRIVAQGQPHEVMRAPRIETVAHLAGFENIFDAKVVALNEARGTMTCRVMPCQQTPANRPLGNRRLPGSRASRGSGVRNSVGSSRHRFVLCASAFEPAICCWRPSIRKG
jgi:ABC-type Fe3+/spermidine/putrescine transport system ATPase subunit